MILGNTNETLARADEGLRIANKHATYYRSKLNLQLTKIEHLIQKEVSIFVKFQHFYNFLWALYIGLSINIFFTKKSID